MSRSATDIGSGLAAQPRVAPGDIAVFWPLGSASGAEPGNPLNQSFGVHEPGGFDRWLERWIRPLHERGFRRVIVHNPFGNEPGGAMDLDQAFDQIEAGRAWQVAEFDAMLAAAGERLPGLELIVYVGTREQDLSAALGEGRYRDHLVRAASMLLLTRVLDHEHVTLAFDAASNYEDDSPERRLVEMARAYKRRQGRDVYVEPIPSRAWQRGYPWIALERYYARCKGRPASSDAPAIRVFNTPGDYAAWDGDGWAWIADCLREGHTPALGWNLDGKGSPWSGVSAAEIATRASALAARPARRVRASQQDITRIDSAPPTPTIPTTPTTPTAQEHA